MKQPTLQSYIIYVILSLLRSTSLGFNLNIVTRFATGRSATLVKAPSHKFSNALCMSSSNAYASQLIIETKQIQLSQVSAEIKICKPSNGQSKGNGNDTGSDPFASIRNLLQNKATSVKQTNTPPLLFIHGSFHASWCWADHYMSYFASLGYPCYALSLRGTGGTFAGEGVKKVKIQEHVGDLTDFISYIRESEGLESKPVLIAHSFGGLAIMKYLETNLLDQMEADASETAPDELLVSGVASLCSVPPSGNGKMILRFLKRSLVDSWKITTGLAMKKCITDEKLCRELFFDEDDDGISNEDLKRFQGYFMRDTIATIDLANLAKQLPINHVNGNGKAVFLPNQLPSLVIGAKDDFIVDDVGVQETAKYYGVEPVFVDSPHDIMLGSKWFNGANALKRWLEDEV